MKSCETCKHYVQGQTTVGGFIKERCIQTGVERRVERMTLSGGQCGPGRRLWEQTDETHTAPPTLIPTGHPATGNTFITPLGTVYSDSAGRPVVIYRLDNTCVYVGSLWNSDQLLVVHIDIGSGTVWVWDRHNMDLHQKDPNKLPQ